MATPEFISRWRSGIGSLKYFVKLDLPRADGTQVDSIYASIGDNFSPANSDTLDPARAWSDLVVSIDPVHIPGDFGSTDLALCSSSITLHADRDVTFPAGIGAALTKSVRESIATHVWLSGRATIHRFFDELADFKHAQCILYKAGILGVSIENGKLVAALRQVIPWNKSLALRTVTKQEFPRAPDSAIGVAFPIRLGDPSIPMRRPYTPNPTGVQLFNTLSAGTPGRRFRSVLADPGRGTPTGQNVQPRIYVAGHEVKTVADQRNGFDLWMKTKSGPAMLFDFDHTGGGVGISTITPFNAVTGSGYTIPNTGRYAMIRMIPGEIVQTANMADNARTIFDATDSNYAFFDVTASKKQITFLLSIPSEDVSDGTGSYCAWEAIIGYQTYQSTNFGFWQSTNPILTAPEVLPNSPTPTIARLTGFSVPTSTWPSTLQNIPFCIGYAGTTALDGTYGWAKVFFVGFVIYFRPKQEVVQSERIISTQELDIRRAEWLEDHGYTPFSVPARTPPVTEVIGEFMDRTLGARDDTAGTYTGTPTTRPVIERAPDQIVYLLNSIAGVPLTDIERTVGGLGSFADARDLLKVNSVYPIHCVDVIESTDILTPILWLTRDTLTQLRISPYDNKHRLVVWKDNQAVNYPYSLGREDIVEPLGPSVKTTPLTDVVTDVKVSYGVDGDSGGYRCEVALAPDKSSSGYEFKNVRDGNLTVISGKNDRMDMRSNNSAGGAMVDRTMALTAGTYVPQSDKSPASGLDYIEGFAQQVKGQLAWAEGTQAVGSRYQVTWGTMITTGYNYRLSFITGTSTLVTLFVPANDGTLTCEQLAAAVQTAVVAGGGAALTSFTCGYDRSLNKFWVRHTNGGTAIKIKGTTDGSDYTSVHMQQTCWATLGFYQGGADHVLPASTTVYADDIRIEEHFAIMNLGGSGGSPGPTLEFELMFQTGVNWGADSASSVRHCADLLGFLPQDQLLGFSGNNGHSYCADGPKCTREKQMEASANLYGRRRELNVRANTIQKGVGARALRDRISDMFRAPRTLIQFSTKSMPDVEVGHVFNFREEMPVGYIGPGSNGLWVGKKFMVVEAIHHNGPIEASTEVVAVDIGKLAEIIVVIGLAVIIGGAAVRMV